MKYWMFACLPLRARQQKLGGGLGAYRDAQLGQSSAGTAGTAVNKIIGDDFFSWRH